MKQQGFLWSKKMQFADLSHIGVYPRTQWLVLFKYLHILLNFMTLSLKISYRNGIQGDCRLLIKCVRFFFEIQSLQSSPCSLADGGQGVCCPHSLVLQTDLGNSVFMWKNILDYKDDISVTQTTNVDAGCPRNIICPPPPPVVVIPNIRSVSSY